MKFEGARNKSPFRKDQPRVVKDAISRGDTRTLSDYGKKGAVKKNERHEAIQAFDEYLAEKRTEQRATEDEQLRKDTNEDILPFDSGDEREAA
jgi:hypothetical protein